MSNRIGVFLETQGKTLTESSSELLTLAVDLAKTQGSELIAFIGNCGKLTIEDLTKLPVDKVYYHQDPAMAIALANAICQTSDFDLFLTPMTADGRELGPYLALLNSTEYIPGVSGLETIDGNYHLTRLVAEGLAQETKTYDQAQSLVLGIVPGLCGCNLSFDGQAKAELLNIQQAETVEICKEYLAAWQEIGVDEASVVLAGGSGLKDKVGFDLLESLCPALAAPMGGSRVVEDKGFIAHEKMIGATGKTIAPQLYIACGISGAIQHMVGIQGAKSIIAINPDPMCPMMTGADLAVVGDGKAVLSALTEALKAYKPKEEA